MNTGFRDQDIEEKKKFNADDGLSILINCITS